MKEKDNILKKGTPVFYLAKDGKHIQKASVVGMTYYVILPNGQRSYVDAEHCAASPTALIKNLNDSIKERICLAYFKAVDAVAKVANTELFPLSEVEGKKDE